MSDKLSHHSQIKAPPVPTPALDELARKANYHHNLAEKQQWNTVTNAIHSGLALIDAKAQMRHSEWLPWVKQNLVFSERTAQVYMQLARKPQRAADSTSIREALRAIALPLAMETIAATIARKPRSKGAGIDRDTANEIRGYINALEDVLADLEYVRETLADIGRGIRDPNEAIEAARTRIEAISARRAEYTELLNTYLAITPPSLEKA